MKLTRPRAITMWDFSWLERRWSGGGYEDWGKSLDELKERGYDAVRIDVYPHLFALDPEGPWTLLPAWDQQCWGAPWILRVENIREAVLSFIRLCRERSISVGLSTWYRVDETKALMRIKTPSDLASVWKSVLSAICEAGLSDAVLYVDLCNEYPQRCWIPFLYEDEEYKERVREGADRPGEDMKRSHPVAVRWMKESIALLKKDFPQFLYTFSQVGEYDELERHDTSAIDVAEPHIWMSAYSDYYRELDYNYERFDPKDFVKLALYGEALYRKKSDFWDGKLREGIRRVADWSRRVNKPLITTECWGLVDFKDGPMLRWDWILHLCALGTREAVQSGRWMAIATSNFCGPQFAGMWREIGWHRALTDEIKRGALPEIKGE